MLRSALRCLSSRKTEAWVATGETRAALTLVVVEAASVAAMDLLALEEEAVVAAAIVRVVAATEVMVVVTDLVRVAMTVIATVVAATNNPLGREAVTDPWVEEAEVAAAATDRVPGVSEEIATTAMVVTNTVTRALMTTTSREGALPTGTPSRAPLPASRAATRP